MGTREVAKKNVQLKIRTTTAFRDSLKKLATERGLTITDLIFEGLNGMPLKDYTLEQKLFECIHQFSREINHIGNNINQVTVAIHQINKDRKIAGDEFIEFNALLQAYISKRAEMTNALIKLTNI